MSIYSGYFYQLDLHVVNLCLRAANMNGFLHICSHDRYMFCWQGYLKPQPVPFLKFPISRIHNLLYTCIQ